MSSNSYYLGIADSHDSGIAVISEGRIIAAINEERLSRRKMATGFPSLCIEYALDRLGIRPEQIAGIGLAGKASAGSAIPLTNDFANEDGTYLASQRAAELIDRLPGGRALMSSTPSLSIYRASMGIVHNARIFNVRQRLAQLGIAAPVRAYDHHDAHLASAYFSSAHADALIISNDGFGDGLCSKVAIGNTQTNAFEVISENSFFNSLGVYYNYATLLCGFTKAHHAGKTTGLAAFGDPSKTIEVFRDLIFWDDTAGRYLNKGGVFRNCITELRKRLVGFSREDIAAGIQSHCEDILSAMVCHHVDRTKRRNLLLVGGVHANVKANQRIAESANLENLVVFPNMGDGGLPLGAAYLTSRDDGQRIHHSRLEHAYLGPSYTEGEILAAIQEHQLAHFQPMHMAVELAKLLSEEKVVARFDGAMEYGPRALGNRSILYSATKPEVNKWLNQQLNRTEFMPFAPVMRAEDAPTFLKNFRDVTALTAEFMTITYAVTERCKQEAPATVHVDGTARPQLVRREINPGYYDLLTEYNRLTGLSILVNTSFNMHEEPIVCSPRDAIRAFLDSRIDVLAIGPFIVTNPTG